MDDRCRPARRLLAQCPVCTVEECACGVLHVTLGVLTIRLQTEVVASVWQTLGEALQRLSGFSRSEVTNPTNTGRRVASERPS
jgi:hypothetical protein